MFARLSVVQSSFLASSEGFFTPVHLSAKLGNFIYGATHAETPHTVWLLYLHAVYM